MEDSQSKDTSNSNYFDEISVMMHGFGDSPTPNPETVQLVENLVRKQLREMLMDIIQKNAERNFKLIKTEDIIFYLRRNKEKVQRLVKYINYKFNESNVKFNTGAEYTETHKKVPKNLYSTVRSFLDTIDETGELSDTSTFDAVKYSRNIRAERISSSLDEEKYLEYARARCRSFNHNMISQLQNIARFNKWIDPQNDFNLRSGAIELLSFLAYGIVANVTDMALIIRENNSYEASDPLQMKIGHYHNAVMFNVPHISRNNTLHVNKGQPPITVNEIYEVIRRCYMPQTGYMRFSNKSILGKRKLFY